MFFPFSLFPPFPFSHPPSFRSRSKPLRKPLYARVAVVADQFAYFVQERGVARRCQERQGRQPDLRVRVAAQKDQPRHGVQSRNLGEQSCQTPAGRGIGVEQLPGQGELAVSEPVPPQFGLGSRNFGRVRGLQTADRGENLLSGSKRAESRELRVESQGLLAPDSRLSTLDS